MNDTDWHLTNFWYVILSVTTWSVVYFVIVKLNPSRSVMWNCRIMAVMHSLTATSIVELAFISGENLFSNIGEKNTKLENLALISSGGYFIFDFIWCCVMRTEGTMMLLHHVISILSLIGGLCLDHSGAEICITLWGSELTNPFLQIRWYLREAKQYETKFAMFNDFAFFWIFALSRVGVGSGLAYLFYFAKKTIFVIKMFGFIFHGISLIWMWQIYKFVKRKYFTRSRNKPGSLTD